MAWTKAEQASPANVRPAVYSEVVVNDQDKTLDITADLGPKYVIRPRFIEVLYVAAATAGVRLLTLTMIRGGVDVMTMAFDVPAQPDNGETKRVFLFPDRNTVETEIGATGVHLHTMPAVVLGQGDSLRVHAAAGSNAADDMTIHLHADVLSGV